MKITKFREFTILLFLLLTGCNNSMSESTEKSSSDPNIHFNSSIEELAVLVSMPKEPEKVLWQIIYSPGQRDSNLFALLSFNEKDYEFVVSQSNKFEVESDELFDIDFFQQWIKPRLPENVASEIQGDFAVLKGIYGKRPNLFTNAKNSPYIHGRIVPLGNNTVFLNLYTM